MSSCDILVLGGDGMAGAAIAAAAERQGLTVARASRRGQHPVDVRDEVGLRALLETLDAPLIVNTVAIVSVPACEADPGEAWRVNARPAAILAAHARRSGARLVHVSTDHFYSGDGRALHDEQAPVTLLNEYARGKYAGEALALTDPGALVLRTNILGLRSAGGASFCEWALGVMTHDTPATLFDDQFISAIDVWRFAEATLELARSPARGVLNLAADAVYSKAELFFALAEALDLTTTQARRGGVGAQGVPRPDSLGLDVSRAQGMLTRPLPKFPEVVDALRTRILDERRHGHALEQ